MVLIQVALLRRLVLDMRKSNTCSLTLKSPPACSFSELNIAGLYASALNWIMSFHLKPNVLCSCYQMCYKETLPVILYFVSFSLICPTLGIVQECQKVHLNLALITLEAKTFYFLIVTENLENLSISETVHQWMCTRGQSRTSK